MTIRTKRRCGDCQLCCEILEIEETSSPMYTKCQHQCRRGCSIYQDRPQQCAEFECAWLQGLGALADRPDKIDAMFRVEELKHVGRSVTVRLTKGDEATGRVRALIDQVASEKGPAVFVVPADQTKDRRVICKNPTLVPIIRKVLPLMKMTGI